MLAFTLIAVLLGFLLLFRTEIGPFLTHRPVFLGTIAGMLLGVPLIGFLLGLLFEWVWSDQIPAGGIRIPASSVGVCASMLGLQYSQQMHLAHAYPIATLTILIATSWVWTFAYIPIDGILRRAWNIAAENVIDSLEKGSLRQLRGLTAIALLSKWLLTTLLIMLAGVTTAIIFAATQHLLPALDNIPWHWAYLGAGLTLWFRQKNQRSVTLAMMALLAGVGLAYVVR